MSSCPLPPSPCSLLLRTLVGSVILTLVSCAATRRFTASVDDYERYREFRVAVATAKLGAAWRYLRDQPRGRWRRELTPWFSHHEQVYLEKHWDSIPQLEDYLRAIPDSERSAQVLFRVQQLTVMARGERQDELTLVKRERQRRAEMDRAKLERSAFLQQVTEWVARLSRGQDLGKPRDAWSGELRHAFFEQEPGGICRIDTCTKTLRFAFNIPNPHAGSEHPGASALQLRRVNITIELNLHEDVIEKASLEAERLFDRVSEAVTLRPVEPHDLQARAEAVATAAQVLGLALAVGLDGAGCEAEAISPVVLARECGGRHGELVLGLPVEDLGQESDRIVFWAATAGRDD